MVEAEFVQCHPRVEFFFCHVDYSTPSSFEPAPDSPNPTAAPPLPNRRLFRRPPGASPSLLPSRQPPAFNQHRHSKDHTIPRPVKEAFVYFLLFPTLHTLPIARSSDPTPDHSLVQRIPYLYLPCRDNIHGEGSMGLVERSRET